jgi:hypothetical protein
MMLKRRFCQFSPAIVVMLWAVCVALDLDTQGARVVFLVTFAVTLALHIAWELRIHGPKRPKSG